MRVCSASLVAVLVQLPPNQVNVVRVSSEVLLAVCSAVPLGVLVVI
jgi:hypothetical protein